MNHNKYFTNIYKIADYINMYFMVISKYIINIIQKHILKKDNKELILNYDELKVFYNRNWYHDFYYLGKKTYQFRFGGYKETQEYKQGIIFSQIDKAVKNIMSTNNTISGVELFCADGFFSNYAVNIGVEKMTGIDLEGESGEGNKRMSVLKQAELITKILNNKDKVTFIKGNVFDIKESYDLCLCIGGLYHIENPKKLLELLRKHITKAIIIQTIVSLENEDENYFETPCPGWTWGCRFSHAHLKKILSQTGWEVLEEKRNEIDYNERLCDKGSSYMLCIPK